MTTCKKNQTRTVKRMQKHKLNKDVAKIEGVGWNREIRIRLDKHMTR